MLLVLYFLFAFQKRPFCRCHLPFTIAACRLHRPSALCHRPLPHAVFIVHLPFAIAHCRMPSSSSFCPLPSPIAVYRLHRSSLCCLRRPAAPLDTVQYASRRNELKDNRKIRKTAKQRNAQLLATLAAAFCSCNFIGRTRPLYTYNMYNL